MNTKKTADILRETQTETTSKKNKRRLLLVVLSVFVVIIATALLILPAWTLGEDDAQQKGGIDVSMQQTETDAEAAEGADLQKNDSPEKAIKKAEADAGDAGDAADAADAQAPQDAAEAQAEDPDADPDAQAGADKAEAAEDAEDAEDAETGSPAGSLSGKGLTRAFRREHSCRWRRSCRKREAPISRQNMNIMYRMRRPRWIRRRIRSGMRDSLISAS